MVGASLHHLWFCLFNLLPEERIQKRLEEVKAVVSERDEARPLRNLCAGSIPAKARL